MKIVSVRKKEKRSRMPRIISQGDVVSVVNGINHQITLLRSIIARIEEDSERYTDRESAMRMSILSGSVYPIQRVNHAPLFFVQKDQELIKKQTCG